jgi:class 3 adenylate cyclase
MAAILAADVAGYSRLMGTDEEGTLARLTAHRRELVDPKIAEHYGRVVKTTGDGVLVEFGSVVDAMRCAIDLQRGMTERNAGEPSKSASASISAISLLIVTTSTAMVLTLQRGLRRSPSPAASASHRLF